MTPTEAMALINRVAGAVEEQNLPFDLAVAWEELGLDAWNSCVDAGLLAELLTLARRPQGVLAAAKLARSVLHLVPAKERRPRRAVEAAEAWVAEPTEERSKAADKAADKARLASATNGFYAAYAATYAARAAVGDANTAAYNAAEAAYNAANAGADAVAILREFPCPTTDELILAAARST